jgi:hypothetical protein
LHKDQEEEVVDQEVVVQVVQEVVKEDSRALRRQVGKESHQVYIGLL